MSKSPKLPLAVAKRNQALAKRVTIRELNSNSGDACQILCKVLSKTEPFSAPPASGKSWKKFTVDVFDEEGTKIQALAWDAADTDRLFPALEVGKQYLLSNFDVKPVIFFRDNTTGNKFFINITAATELTPYMGAAAGWKGPVEKIDLSMRVGDMPAAVKDFSVKQSVPVDLVCMLVEQEDPRIVRCKTGPQTLSTLFVVDHASDQMLACTIWGDEKQLKQQAQAGDLLLLRNTSLSSRDGCSLTANDRSTVLPLDEGIAELGEQVLSANDKAIIAALRAWAVTAHKAKEYYDLVSDFKKNRPVVGAGAGAAAGAVPEAVTHVTLDSLARLLQDTAAIVQIKRDATGGGGGGGGGGGEMAAAAAAADGEARRPKLDSTFIESLPKGLFSFRATADAILTSVKQAIMRRACPKQPAGSCGATIREDNGQYRCPKCEKTYETFTYAYLINLQVSDRTDVCTITLFDTDVQQYISDGLKAKELYQLYSQAGKLTLAECNQAMANHLSRLFCDREMLFKVYLSPSNDNTGFMQLTLRSISAIDYAKGGKL